MTEEHLLMCYPDQHSLASALNKRNLDAFRNALRSFHDAEKYDAEKNMSIFELACQTPDSGEFIKECISAGCDVNKINPAHQKRPINYAAESYSEDNLSALLNDPNVNLDAKYSANTPINFLASKIDEDFDRIFACIKLLVKHHANVNIPNNREMTPISHILNNRKLSDENKRTVVTYLLVNAEDIDIDSYRNGEARKLLTKKFPDIELPNIRKKGNETWDFNQLKLCLERENEAEFLRGLNIVAETNPSDLQQLFTASDDNGTLLVLAVRKGLTKAVERMLRLGADINYAVQTQQRPLTAIECACIYGHWQILEILLQSPKINLNTAEPLVSIIVKNIGEQSSSKCNYEKCFQILLKRSDIDLDQQDIYNCSALHYAVKYSNKNAILTLLKHGAYIGVKSSFDQYSISNINPKVFEQHLDSCITTNDFRMGDDNFEICFDYKNLVPVSTRQQRKESVDEDSIVCGDEMAPIEFISKSNELRHLIKHPIITSFLFLKWHRLAFIFYMNLFVYCMFTASILAYIFSCYRDENSSGALKELLRGISCVLTIIIFLREISQVVFAPRKYFQNLENYLEIALLLMVSLILCNVRVTETERRTIAAITILLVAGELFILLGSLEIFSFSTHFIMLKTVATSFIKGFAFYVIILGAFSLCFYALLNEPSEPKDKITENHINPTLTDLDKTEEEEEADFNKFSNVGLSIMKTVVMLTGEFDAASINFNLNAWSYIVFLAFLFLISTVLFNLLNGLAVSDTQEIKSEAELSNFIHRSNLMSRYETIFLGKDISWCCPLCIRWFARSRISIFKNLLPEYKIQVQPNAGNLVKISDKKTKHLECTQFCSVMGGRCSRMPSKIIKHTLQLLEKKKSDQIEESERQELNHRISNIERALADISNKLNSLLSK